MIMTTELKVGDMVKVNKSVGRIIQTRDTHALIQFEDGSKFCFGMSGLKVYQEKVKPGTQLSLI